MKYWYRAFYSLIFYLAIPILLLRLWQRCRLNPDYSKRINERFALNLPSLKKDGIWLHAVSVGEAIAAQRLVFELMKIYPHLPITITCTTPTGSKTIKRLFADSVQHVYLPYDLPCVMRRFIKILSPKIAIMLETEVWPNLISICAKSQIPLVIANARMSERSYLGYKRLLSFSSLIFNQITLIAAQNADDAKRFVDLGAKNVQIMGSIKFDLLLDDDLSDKAQILADKWQLCNRAVWIAASTHAGEDEIILNAHQTVLQHLPDVLLILVPRHPERFTDVANLIKQTNLSYVKRSANVDITPQTQVLLADSMGELMLFYALADIAFVGGSLVNHGGHNLLEPAALKLALFAGKYNFNFAEIERQMLANEALIIVDNESQLSANLLKLLADEALRKQMGANAFEILQNNKGSLIKLIKHLRDIIYA